MTSKSDENTTEELCDEALNVENAVATHFEDQPTPTTHLSFNSDLKSISDDIAVQSIEEHSDDNIISIQNKECDNATKGGVKSHDTADTAEKTMAILDTLINPSDSINNEISNTIEVTEGKDETATEKQVLDDKTSQQKQDDIAMQLKEEYSDNNIISIQNKECDNAAKGGVESHDTYTTEKTQSDQRQGSKSEIILDKLIIPSSDSINNKISNTIEVTEGKDQTATEKQVLDDKTSQQKQDDIAMQSKEEHSDNNIISIQNKECEYAAKGGVESHDNYTTEKTQSDQRQGSKSDIILDTLINPSSNSINNKISNTIEVTDGKDETATEKQVLDDKTSQQEQDDIAMQSNEDHSDNNIILIQNKEGDNATKSGVESHDTYTTEKAQSDQGQGSKSDIILDTLINPFSDSINNKISNTIEVTKGKDETAREKQVLDDKTSQQEHNEVYNEMDVDVLPNTKREQIIVGKANDDSVKVTDDADKNPESELKMDDYDDSDNMTKPSSYTEKDKEDILVPSKPETSSTETPGIELESSLQYDNNGDDKFKLVWEDDDDDASQNISETIQKNDSMEVLELDNTNAQKEIDKSPLDTSSSSFLPTKAHGLNKPDVMLEIPTQDFDEFSDDDDDFGQEQIASLVMSPDVETGKLEEKDKSSRQSAEKESNKSISMETDNNDECQNIFSTLEGDNEQPEISNNQLEQQDQPDTSNVEVNNEPIPKENTLPSCDDQVENNTKYENGSSVILKDKREKQSEIQEETDGNQELSESKCDDMVEKEPQQSAATSSEDHTLDNMHQNPDVEEMSDSLGLLAESSRVMDDDEQEEEPDDDGDGDEEDDSDIDDDNSNQVTAENSEDSNAQNADVESKAKDDTPTTSDKEASEDGMNFPDTVPDAVDINIDEIVVEEDNIGDIQVEETDLTTADKSQNAEEDADNNEQETVTEAIEESVDVPMDIETVKLSDTSDTEMDNDKDDTNIVEIVTNETAVDDNEVYVINENMGDEIVRTEINKNVVDCVYLEATSSDEEVCEVDQESESTTVKMPADIDVISSSGGATSEIVMKETETVISGLPKPPPMKPARINTSEVSIKTTHSKKETITPPELQEESSGQVVNLDSDDEEQEKLTITESTPLEEGKTVGGIKCVNRKCPHNPSAQYSIADSRVIAFFEGDKKKRSYVCEDCYDIIHQKNRELITGIQEFKPFMEFDFGNYHEELVEISDSESEEETEPIKDGGDLIGDKTAKFLEDNLTDIFNEVWSKYRMDERLDDTAAEMQEELKRLQKESLEIDELFKQCQIANDKLRTELYATFEPDIHELPPINIDDVAEKTVITAEKDVKPAPAQEMPSKRPRRSTVGWLEGPPSKKKAIPMGYTPLSTVDAEVQAGKVDDDNTDIAVVKLSLESAPADLPPSGPLTRAPLRPGMAVYAKKKASWLRAVISEILPTKNSSDQFTMCRVKFEHKNVANPHSTVSGRHLAYSTPADTRMIIGTRVIALFKDAGIKEYYSAGIVAEVPNPVNNYRYLIFFDDGYAQYAAHRETRVVCQSSPLVWEEVHVDSRQFVKDYITSYPERPMVRLHAGQNLKTEFKGKWLSCVVEAVDASLVRVAFVDGRREWIYRGSTRLAPLFLELQAAERSRPRAAPRAMPRPLGNKGNMPYVEYTRSNEQAKSAQNAEEIRRQRSVAKKSTTTSQPTPAPATNLDDVTSRVVFYTPKNAVRPHKMVPHKCGPQCKRTDVLQLKDLRTYNPLAKPLLSGWERQIVRWRGHKHVMYVGGCGRRLRNMAELHRYLRATRSDMSVDLFDFSPNTHCLAEFVLNRCIVSKKDLSNGKENVPVPCVNYYDHSLPEFYSYNTERTPTAGVPLNLDPEFLCGCDCEDDCQDKSKCACWQLTLEGARTIQMEGDVGYVYKRLPKPLPTGIYECNSRCKCKHTCLNRVAQHPLQLKLQVFKTLNKGWGIRALNDVPEGSFLCVYAGNLLTDATATLDGLNEGDEFLAELDYIEVVEQMKEGFEEDIPEDAKEQDKEETSESSSEEESSEEEKKSKGEDDDDVDFHPGYIGPGLTDFTKRLRKRDKKNARDKIARDQNAKQENKEDDKNQKSKTDKSEKNDDCITISDDESREPSCFTAAAGMRANEFVSKYKSVRTLYGEDEACYIMDAKVQGNIGRYLNHSCTPNVFVQNVFVDTHDPRFPWVAFFALSHVRAGTELTWNYNYDVGSVPGKVLYCLCGAPNCKGRLL
ncbi:histone-lysine N-methyltransferase eggless [Aricia agestis]|uniref:histone-lysine N-methyltransferase eggless n=1 Tax=Aricia agestis TaxID=91739 RepID=UPI001C206C61|nr:histone-lysine N-methyltransferase eggless [Aricia agestis]